MKRLLSFLLAAVLLAGGVLIANGFAVQNDEATTFISLLNQKRTAQGLVAAGTDAGLMDAAAIRAREQATLVSHDRPDGTFFTTVHSKAEAECYWWFTPPETGTAQKALDSFLNSRDHRELLMNRNLRSIGAAFYDQGDRRYWVILLSTQSTDAPDQPTGGTVGGFVDVHSSDYFAESVLWAVQNRITTGTGANTFSPNQRCTRAEVVTFLWRAAGAPTRHGSASGTFRDVPRGSYYDSAVAWAVANRITNGTGNDRFSPDAVCTRAEAVTFLWRSAGSPFTFGTAGFRDVPSGSYYARAVVWAVRNGITEGTSATTFSPDEACTRAQFVTFLYRQKT